MLIKNSDFTMEIIFTFLFEDDSVFDDAVKRGSYILAYSKTVVKKVCDKAASCSRAARPTAVPVGRPCEFQPKAVLAQWLAPFLSTVAFARPGFDPGRALFQ